MFSTGGGADTVYQHVASDINTDQVQKDDETIPTVSCDYAYMSDSDSPDTIRILVIRNQTTKAYAATAICKTGVAQYAVQFFVGFMRELGWRRCISRSDGENSLVALKTAVRDAMPDVEINFPWKVLWEIMLQMESRRTPSRTTRDTFVS